MIDVTMTPDIYYNSPCSENDVRSPYYFHCLLVQKINQIHCITYAGSPFRMSDT